MGEENALRAANASLIEEAKRVNISQQNADKKILLVLAESSALHSKAEKLEQEENSANATQSRLNKELSKLQYEDSVARAVKHGAEDEMSRAVALQSTSIANLRKARHKEQVANETAKHALQALEEAHQSVVQALAATAVAEKKQADFEMARVREEEKALRAANTSLIEQEEHISKDDGNSGIAGSAAEISALQSKVHRLEKDDKKDDKKHETAEKNKKKGEKEDEKKDEN